MQEHGNVSEVARQFGLERTGLVRHFGAMGLQGKGVSLNGKNGGNEKRNRIIEYL